MRGSEIPAEVKFPRKWKSKRKWKWWDEGNVVRMKHKNKKAEGKRLKRSNKKSIGVLWKFKREPQYLRYFLNVLYSFTWTLRTVDALFFNPISVSTAAPRKVVCRMITVTFTCLFTPIVTRCVGRPRCPAMLTGCQSSDNTKQKCQRSKVWIRRLHVGAIWLPLPECFANFLSYSDFYSLGHENIGKLKLLSGSWSKFSSDRSLTYAKRPITQKGCTSLPFKYLIF
jgi:hypothetical protein